MGAETRYYAIVPRIEYDVVECYGVVAQDVFNKYPMAFDVFHSSDEEKLNEYLSNENVHYRKSDE